MCEAKEEGGGWISEDGEVLNCAWNDPELCCLGALTRRGCP